MTFKYNVNNVPLTDIFDPYISGTKAPLTGYTTTINGVEVDLRDQFAPIYLGISAGPTNYKVNNADLNTIFAKKGTAQYALPIDGTVYSQNVNIFSAGSGNANLTFSASPTTYAVVGGGAGGTLTPPAGTRASGPVPAGATKVKYTTAIVSGSGGTVTNGAATATALSGTPSVIIAQGGTGTGPGNDVRYSVRIEFYSASGALISTTTIYFDVSYEGSA